jgi:hypothetical protein
MMGEQMLMMNSKMVGLPSVFLQNITKDGVSNFQNFPLILHIYHALFFETPSYLG